MTHPRKTKLTIATRLGAAMSLVVWLAAFLFCSNHCCVGESDGGHEEHEHAAASHHDGHHAPEPDHQDKHQDSFCDSLKSVVHTAAKEILTKPDFGLAFILNLLEPSQISAIAEPQAPVFRQAWRGEWTFTPEVCLGPAFRSLAPPVASLS